MYPFVNKVQNGKNEIHVSPLIKKGDYGNKTVFALISFPAAFTPICGSEIPYYDRLKIQLEQLDATINFISTDTVETLIKYTTPGKIENNLPSIGNLNYPIICDRDREIIVHAGLIDENTGLTARGILVYTFDEAGNMIVIHKEIRHKNISRNIGDLLTIIRAYRFIEQNDGRCLPDMYQKLETLAYYPGVNDVNSAREYLGPIPIDPALR